MARSNHKPINRYLSRRIMKMGCAYYPQPNAITGNKPVPWLNMRGLWLRQAGFEVGSLICIEVSKGRLIITPNKEDAR